MYFNVLQIVDDREHWSSPGGVFDGDETGEPVRPLPLSGVLKSLRTRTPGKGRSNLQHRM